MHVLMVPSLSMSIPPEGYGGSQRVICWLTEEFMRMGKSADKSKFDNIAVTLVGVKDSRSTRSLPITSLDIRARRRANRKDYLKYFTAIQQKLAGKKIDVIHGHGHWIQWIKDFFPDIPIVSTIHGHQEELPQDAHLIFISEAQKKSYLNFYPKVKSVQDSVVIHNPIPVEAYRYSEQKKDYFLFLAKINWAVKGFEVALRIARTTGIQLIVCGQGMSWWQKMMLPANVKYEGEVDGKRKQELLTYAKALLYPTRWNEPFGLAPAEANASGTPALVFNHGAMPEVICHGVSGFLCGSTVPEMIAKISLLHQLSPKKCREWITKKFVVEKIAQQYLTCYQKLIR